MALRAGRSTPFVVLADQDGEASGRLMEGLPDFEVLTVRGWPRLRDAVEHLAPDLVLLADTLSDPRMKVEKMVEELYRDHRMRVIVLMEFPAPDGEARWRERGAAGCILHPTKAAARLGALKRLVCEHIYLTPSTDGGDR
jgi:AmiR/NasT family two-component response regulator